jgi:succinoglycan biosynthesis protein ExoM
MYVSVCICTLNRSSVADTVRSVFAQAGWGPSEMEIIVCDDDPGGSARSAVEALAAESPLAVRYLHSGKRNVATCRNRCLEFAVSDWVAFIDDDQTAEPNWLSELLACQARYAAEVVKAHVRAMYPPQCPRWVLVGDPFTRDYGPQGTPLTSAATNGVLFRKSFATENGIQFDPRFGRTGGEDVDFFGRLHNAGARMVSCRTAVVNEHVSSSRVTASYLRHRGRRSGHIRGTSYISRLAIMPRLVGLGKSLAMAVACLGYPLVAPISTRLGFYMFSKFWLHLGVLEWALGRQSLTMEL